MPLNIWLNWQHCRRRRLLAAVTALQVFESPLLPLYSQPIITFQGSDHNLTPGKAKEEGGTSRRC